MLEDDLLQQARSADLSGRYEHAEKLRKQWCEKNARTCDACGETFYPGYHDHTECTRSLLSGVMET